MEDPFNPNKVLVLKPTEIKHSTIQVDEVSNDIIGKEPEAEHIETSTTPRCYSTVSVEEKRQRPISKHLMLPSPKFRFLENTSKVSTGKGCAD